VRVYVIGRGYQATDINVAEAAGRFITWLADDANALLTEVIKTWLWQPPDTGGLGALAESAWDVAVLRAEVIANWRHDPERCPAEGRAAR
jgi:hypothetical protein